MSYANHKKIYVATYKEILIGFIVFVLILVILYPKDTLTKQVLAEDSNYDLSVLYLKNMLKNDPSNEELMLSLARQAYLAKKKDLSFKLLKLLRNSKNEQTRKDAYKLSYEIAKEDYFYLKKMHKTEALSKKYAQLHKLFSVILTEHFYNKDEVEKLYKESYFLNDNKDAYLLVQKLLQQKPNEIKLLKDAYYLSYKLHDYAASMHYLDLLYAEDSKNQKKWLDEKYFLLTQHYQSKEAEAYIIARAQTSSYWRERLINFYLLHKRYKKAAQIYMNEFHSASTRTEQRELWLQALHTLQAGGELKAAVRLGHRYENYFLHDKKARMALLKLYFSANDVKKANRLSQKILRIKR